MKKIDYYTKHQRVSTAEIEGPVEHDPEYLLIVDANNLLVEIDIIHSFVKGIYHQRFPELEQLVQLSMDYLKTVQALGNNVHQAKFNENLSKILTQATIMIVNVSASTTQGIEKFLYMTLPGTSEKSRISEASFTSPNEYVNPFYSTLFSHLTSQQQQQQQQLLLTQLLLSGATCPPLNPLANALQFLLHNSALLLQQQQNFASCPISSSIDSHKPKESISPVNSKHKNDSNTSVPLDCSLSDTNGKTAFDEDDNSPTIATTLATLPINNNESTTVDGINLEEIKQFAKAFKLRRLALGLTQTQVGQALSVTRGPAYSQSAICRFEKLDITPKSASKIKPVLEKWMREAELKYADRLKNGPTNLQDLVTDANAKKRKRRTSFAPQALERLNDAFELNTHPSGIDMSTLAHELNYDREVIRVWFCNKRQALKNSVKKFKSNQIDEDNDSTSSLLLNTNLSDATNYSKVEHDEPST